MAAVLLVDGALAGYTILGDGFAKILTPNTATVAAVAWGAATSLLLFKLASAAARESVLVERTASLARRAGSSRAHDRAPERIAMNAIGISAEDLSPIQRRKLARVALIVVVAALSAFMVALRVAGYTPADDVATAAGSDSTPTATQIQRLP